MTDGHLLSRYPSVDWRGAKATRDFLAHHYFGIDHGLVFNICTHLLPALASVVEIIIADLEKNPGLSAPPS